MSTTTGHLIYKPSGKSMAAALEFLGAQRSTRPELPKCHGQGTRLASTSWSLAMSTTTGHLIYKLGGIDKRVIERF